MPTFPVGIANIFGALSIFQSASVRAGPFPANSAYGTGVSSWRGSRVSCPAWHGDGHSTVISRKRALPSYTFPKSSCTAKCPSITVTRILYVLSCFASSQVETVRRHGSACGGLPGARSTRLTKSPDVRREDLSVWRQLRIRRPIFGFSRRCPFYFVPCVSSSRITDL